MYRVDRSFFVELLQFFVVFIVVQLLLELQFLCDATLFVVDRLQYCNLVSHRLRGMDEHPAKLATAHHAKPGCRRGRRNQRGLHIAHTGSTIAPGGLPDILGLGIVITRLNVGEIIPEGRTVEATEQASSTEILLQTAVMLKKAYEQAGETRTLDECIVEARRVLATQTGGGNFVDVPGLGSIIQGLGHR